jgi:signal transduction histidine kinase/ligand-binding sensor domain-containing protein
MARRSLRWVTTGWIAALLAIGGSAPLWAQYRVDNWTTENGLPQSSINDVIQTREGFLWLATFGGLVRFDGAEMHVFNTLNTQGVGTSRFTNLFEAKDGALWASTEGRGVTRYKDRAFTTYTEANGLPDNRVSAVFEDKDGALLIDTAKGIVQWKGERFLAYPAYFPNHGEADKTILTAPVSGVVWYSDREGVHKFEGGRVSRHLPLDVKPRRLYEDRSGGIWMEFEQASTRKRTIARFEDGRLRIFTAKDGIPVFSTVSFFEDRDGNLWLGLRAEGGLLRFRAGKFTRFTTADGLSSNNTGTVHQDREGSLWVPTDGGLSRFTERTITAYSSKAGLAADNAYPIYQDRRGDIWIGTWRGLSRYRNGVFTRINDFGVDAENVLSILEARDGAYWIGTWGGGVRRIKDGHVTSFRDAKPPGNVTRAIYQDRRSDIWFGGPDGLARYRDGKFVAMAGQQGFLGGQAHVFHEDRQGALWIGTEAGLSCYRFGTFTNFGEKEGLTGSHVRAIHEDDAGSLWFGTYESGLFRYRDGRFTRYTTKEGLFSNGAFRILEDRRGRFWISSNIGIYHVARKDLDDLAAGRAKAVTSVSYGTRDGMPDAECNGGGQPAGIQARDGRMWFPTQQGLAVLDPETIPVNYQPPPIVITDVLVAHEPVPMARSMEIYGGPKALEVRYAALTLIRPELSRFKYRMAGLDDAWVDASSRRSAYFAHLPFGNYEFQVVAANRDGVWNMQGESIRIHMVPPFWRTRWFLTLGVLTVAALGLGGHRLRLGFARKEHALREEFARQLIESQEDERKRIAAGLQDSLSQSLILIKNCAVAAQSTNEARVARGKLGEISATATQALGEVRDIAYDLGPYQLERIGLAETILQLVDKASGSTGIAFTTRVGRIDGLLSKQAEINLFRILQEAINNLVKHSGSREATLTAQPDSGSLLVSLQDRGKGFDYAATFHRTERRQGFGLFRMSERVRMIGGTLAVESSPGQGTRIEIRLPLDLKSA